MYWFWKRAAAIAALMAAPCAMAQATEEQAPASAGAISGGAIVATRATVPDATCELHVWPGSDLTYLDDGWSYGGTQLGSYRGRAAEREGRVNPLTTEIQRELLTTEQPERLFYRANYHVIVHSEALPSSVIRTSTGRISDSKSTCYTELIVDDLIVSDKLMDGEALRTLFRIRDFGADTLPKRVFGTWTTASLRENPLKAAFASNLRQFIAAFHRVPPKKR